MKTKITLFALLISACLQADAQVVNEDVNFDFYQSATTNDFTNHFSGSFTLSQIQTNGITGGSLDAPDSIDWGNDRAAYCTKLKPNVGDTSIISLCFKYDTTSIDLPSFQRAATIFMHPNADFNHYIIASVLGDKHLQLVSYSAGQSTTLQLLHNHWYRLQLSTIFTGGAQNTVYMKGDVFELGLNGTSPPALLNTTNASFNDAVLMADTSITVSINGTTYGGGAYLDNFHFHGRKGLSTCINVGAGITEPGGTNTLNAYFTSDNILHVTRTSANKGKAEVTIFSTEGKLVLKSACPQLVNDFNLSPFGRGLYIVRVTDENETKSFRFLVEQ